MRTTMKEVAGLPAGTRYEVYVDQWGIRRLAWIAPDGLKRSARVDGKGRLAELTAAGALCRAHVEGLECEPDARVPCGTCGEEIAACLTRCPKCGVDPDADVPCWECRDHTTGLPTGFIDYRARGGRFCRTEVCPFCWATLTAKAPFAEAREKALAQARRLCLFRRAERQSAIENRGEPQGGGAR